MFDFLTELFPPTTKTKNKIELLQSEIAVKNIAISEYRQQTVTLKEELKSKKKIICYCNTCLDWEKGNCCSLSEVIIKTDGKEAFCMDYDNGSVMDELKAEVKGTNTNLNIILNESAQ